MIDWLFSVFGTYTPITYTDSSGVDVIPAGFAGVDWQYLAGVAVFLVVTVCIFKLLATLFKRG